MKIGHWIYILLLERVHPISVFPSCVSSRISSISRTNNSIVINEGIIIMIVQDRFCCDHLLRCSNIWFWSCNFLFGSSFTGFWCVNTRLNWWSGEEVIEIIRSCYCWCRYSLGCNWNIKTKIKCNKNLISNHNQNVILNSTSCKIVSKNHASNHNSWAWNIWKINNAPRIFITEGFSKD